METYSVNQNYKVRTIYLTNFYNHIAVPPLHEIIKMGDGLNIQYEHVTNEIVQALHANEKIVCVWIDGDVTIENVEIYCRVFDL